MLTGSSTNPIACCYRKLIGRTAKVIWFCCLALAVLPLHRWCAAHLVPPQEPFFFPSSLVFSAALFYFGLLGWNECADLSRLLAQSAKNGTILVLAYGLCMCYGVLHHQMHFFFLGKDMGTSWRILNLFTLMACFCIAGLVGTAFGLMEYRHTRTHGSAQEGMRKWRLITVPLCVFFLSFLLLGNLIYFLEISFASAA